MAIAPDRYSEGLMRVAIQSNKVDEIEQQLDFLDKNILNDEFYEVINYPKYNDSKKAQIIREITKNYLDDYIIEFLEILLRHGRINIIRPIISTYKEKANMYRDIHIVEVFSAFELDSEQIERLKEKIKSLFKVEKVELKIILDSSIIGGIKIKKGDVIIDDTISTKLENMKNIILK